MSAAFGVWTPWAEALCMTCHDTRGGNPQTSGFRKIIPPASLDGLFPGVCTSCSTPILMERDDVAILSRLRSLLRADGLAVDLDQTGGMCSALYFDRPDRVRVFVTWGVDDATEQPSLEVGLYRLVEEDGETVMSAESIGYETFLGGDDVLAAAVRAACEVPPLHPTSEPPVEGRRTVADLAPVAERLLGSDRWPARAEELLTIAQELVNDTVVEGPGSCVAVERDLFESLVAKVREIHDEAVAVLEAIARERKSEARS